MNMTSNKMKKSSANKNKQVHGEHCNCMIVSFASKKLRQC